MQTADYQKAVSDLADKYLNAEIKKGLAFSEALCNWAINKALQELSMFRLDERG